MKKLILTFVTLLNGFLWAELDLEQFCADKDLNEVRPHPQHCGGYISCSEEPTVQYCEEGFHFDIKSLTCNWPEKVNCQLPSRQFEEDTDFVEPLLTSLNAYDILTGQVISPMRDYNPRNVMCRHFGAYFLPHPRKCRSYYLCAYGHIHEYTCAPHTLWDYKLQQCVLSHHAICYRFNQEEEKELNLILDHAMMVCYPTKANLSFSTNTIDRTVPTTAPVLTTAPPPTPPIITMLTTTTKRPTYSNPYNITCPVKRQSYLAHPEDCSKYFMCILGTAVMTSCPKGLLWDAKNAYCDVSKNVKCFQKKIIN